MKRVGKVFEGRFLAAQWLGYSYRAFISVGWVRCLVREVRSHKPLGATKIFFLKFLNQISQPRTKRFIQTAETVASISYCLLFPPVACAVLTCSLGGSQAPPHLAHPVSLTRRATRSGHHPKAQSQCSFTFLEIGPHSLYHGKPGCSAKASSLAAPLSPHAQIASPPPDPSFESSALLLQRQCAY